MSALISSAASRLSTSKKANTSRPPQPSVADRSWPRLSIITPSFNQAEFLERTIRSVLSQGYPNLEYIIIDGGSTDESVEIIRAHEAYLSHWVSEKDSGQSEALNKGFRRATGEYVGWQNSDDLYLSGSFFDAVNILTSDRTTDFVFANRLDIDQDDQIIGESRFTPFSLIGYWYEGMSLSNQSTFWRREVFDQVGYLDETLHAAMDYEFFLRCAIAGASFRHVRRYWGALRRHAASKGNTIWATTMQADCDQIDERYHRKVAFNVPYRIISGIRRAFYYTLQGDLDYLVRGLARRAHVYFRFDA